MLRVDNALGATVEPVDAGMARSLGLPGSSGGLVVTSVANKGPAISAGLRVGDIIEKIGGRPATSVNSNALSTRRHSNPRQSQRQSCYREHQFYRNLGRPNNSGNGLTKKILVVEDDPTTADYLASGLEQNGYVVDRAITGRDGLFHATDGNYAAIVLDRMLPGMDGLAVLSALRAAGIETPVIILSALGSTDETGEGA